MTTGNLTAGLAFMVFASLMPVGLAGAEPPPIEPPAPLSVPTPGAPKLRLPQIAPPPPSMMLDQIRPLQVPDRSARPTLNRFPSAEPESDEEAPTDRDGEPRIRLEHR